MAAGKIRPAALQDFSGLRYALCMPSRLKKLYALQVEIFVLPSYVFLKKYQTVLIIC
jgi:hypothetical protein